MWGRYGIHMPDNMYNAATFIFQPEVTLLSTGVTALLGYLASHFRSLLIISLCLALAHHMHRGNLAGMARSNRAVAKLHGLRTILRCLLTLLEASLAC